MTPLSKTGKTQNHALIAIVSALTLGAGIANAATTFQNNGSSGSIYVSSNWSNGLPGTGNTGTITTAGASIPDGLPQFAAGTYTINSSANITAVDEFAMRIATVGSSLTWNMTGGSITTRWITANGQNGAVTINMSGGTINLANVAGTGQFGVQNNGIFNISGSAAIDGTYADVAVQTAGTIDIAGDWTGYWINGPYTGTEWHDHFVAGQIKYNGSAIDEETFNSTFLVTNGGSRLQLIPEPSSLALLSFGGLCMLRRRRRA